MTTLFDTYLFVDWSASSRPTRVTCCENAIWIGEASRETVAPSTTYCRTRHEAFDYVKSRLKHHVAQGNRLLVGFDFAYGFPAGTAKALRCQNAQRWLNLWKLLSDRVEDSDRNANNRWEVASSLNDQISHGCPGPFWGCPKSRQSSTLTTRRNGKFSFPYSYQGGLLCERRRTEHHLPRAQEVWKLLGAGSVGSQALLGIPYVEKLRFDPALATRSLVWPFETGFEVDALVGRQPLIVHAEIWPGIVEEKVQASQTGRIRDQVQVEQLCLWAQASDFTGELAQHFCFGNSLPADDREQCCWEEGWILGSGRKMSR